MTLISFQTNQTSLRPSAPNSVRVARRPLMIRSQAPSGQPGSAPKAASPVRVKLFNAFIDLVLGKNPSKEHVNRSFLETIFWDPLETVQKIRQHPLANVNQPDAMGLTPLHIAAGHTYVERVPVLEYLIAQGANVNEGHRVTGTPALFMAAYMSRWDSVKTLMKHGADINQFIPGHQIGNTLLAQMAKQGSAHQVENVLQLGADPNIAEENGKTPLHLAAERGRTQIVERLLRAGAQIDAAGKNGNTPLMDAVIQKQVKTVQLLLKKGADPQIANSKGKTPLQIAQKLQNKALVELLDKVEQGH